MDDGSEWTPKDRKTETEVERCYTKGNEGERSIQKRSTRPENVENENALTANKKRNKFGRKIFCVPFWYKGRRLDKL